MKFARSSLFFWLVCLIALVGIIPLSAQAKNYGEYEDVAYVYDQGSCPSMQGMSVHGDYVYACKIDGDTEASAVVARANKNTGDVSYLVNAATGGYFFYDFGHGNDIEVETLGGVTTLLVPTSITGSGGLVRYKLSGTTATKVGSYSFTYKGSAIGGGALRVMYYNDTSCTFLFKSGQTCFTGTLPYSQTSGSIALDYWCTLDYSSCYVNGVYKDTSDYSLQGMGYHDFKLYLPLSGHTVSGHENISIILVYDMEGASGTIKPEKDLTFQITSSYYGAYFEVESCEISPKDGRMYFSANRRRTNSDTNHDGISYISNWTYTPATRYSGVNNYRWKPSGSQMVSCTSGGNTYNGIRQLEGTITDGTFNLCRFVLSKPVVLKHNLPWVVEWKSAGGIGGTMHFATEPEVTRTNAPYIYRRGGSASLLAMGYYDGTYYRDSGIDLADHGLNESELHVYRLTNKIAADGSNMVWLSVDGKELGPMNNYYVNGYDQGSTTNWLNGRDFQFSYIGVTNYRVHDITLEYMQVWYNGIYNRTDEPNTYLWESQNSTLTSSSDFGLTRNDATLTSGSVSGSTYSSCQYELSRNIVLMHNRPWTIQWKSSGSWSDGVMLLAADHMGNTQYAPYLFRGSKNIVLGQYTGSRHQQWGVCLTDYGVDMSATHTFALHNRIEADGSNTIWLYVDGQELAPMTAAFSNNSPTGATTNTAAGVDWVFSYIGAFPYNLTGQLSSLQIWESGSPDLVTPQSYQWTTESDILKERSTNPALMLTGSCASGFYEGAQFALERSVILRHDRPWRIRWETQGNWTGGGMLLSASISGSSTNNLYLLRSSRGIMLGLHNGSRYEQWGINPANYGVDINDAHTYELVNRVAEDGSNMVYLLVDGQELGALNQAAVNGSYTGETSDFLSGKDLTFSYIGTKEFTVNDTTLTSLTIYENCGHSYQTVVTAPTCTAGGYTTYTCTICGDSYTGDETAVLSHSYTALVTPPTCTAGGYTTYTCTLCGDSYIGNETAITDHRYTGKVTTAPSCTATGIRTYTCTGCGHAYTEVIPASNHTYKAVVTAPGCTTQGYTTYTCTACGTSYRDAYTNATGHSYTGQITTPATCTTSGKKTFTCGCGSSYTEGIPALGHSYAAGYCALCGSMDPANNPDLDYYLFGYINGANYACEDDYANMGQYRFVDGKLTTTFQTDSYVAVKAEGNVAWYMTEGWQGNAVTSVTLYNTETLFAADKMFVPGGVTVTFTLTNNGDGSLTLSYAPVQEVTAPNITMKYPSLSFEDVIIMNVYYTAEGLQDVVELGLITNTVKPDVVSIENADAVIPGYGVEGSFCFSSTAGIAPKDIGDTIYFAVYAKLSDGTVTYTRMIGYSPKTYALNQLTTGTAEMRPLVAAMLGYGAAAQTYFNYKTDSLVNATMTADQKAMAEAYRSDMIATVTQASGTKLGTFINDKTYSQRYPTISFEGAFCINYYYAPSLAVVGDVTMYVWSLEDFQAASVLTKQNATKTIKMELAANGEYTAVIDGIAAKDLDKAVYVSFVYSDGTTEHCGGVIGYTIGAYCKSQASGTGTLAELAKACAVYGYYAKQLFN